MSTARRLRRQAARHLVNAGPPALPAWLADQVDAASTQTAALAQRIEYDLGGAVSRFDSSAVRHSRAVRVDLIAAVLRCERCPHFGGGPQPMIARLSDDKLECLACLATSTSTPDPANADRCDICESRGHRIFREVVISAGPLQIHGNAASCCWERLGIAAEVAS